MLGVDETHSLVLRSRASAASRRMGRRHVTSPAVETHRARTERAHAMLLRVRWVSGKECRR